MEILRKDMKELELFKNIFLKVSDGTDNKLGKCVRIYSHL
jgi:hypothetical protein